MRHRPSFTIWGSAAIVVAGFLGTAAVAKYSPESSRRLIPVMAVAVPGYIAYLCMRVNRHRERVVSLALAITPTLLVAGAFALFLVVDNDAARAAVVVAAAVLCSCYFTYLLGMRAHDGRFQHEDFLHLSFVMHVLTMFFVLAAAYGVSGFTSLSAPALAVCVAVIALLTSAETFRRAGTLASGAGFAFAFALISAEIAVALSFLPTSGLVDATVGTVLYAAGLHIATWSLAGRTDARTTRTQFAFSFFLAVLVLSTARWN